MLLKHLSLTSISIGYYIGNYYHYYRQQQHKQWPTISSGRQQWPSILSTDSLSSASLIGQLFPAPVRTTYTMIDDNNQAAIDKLWSLSAPMYVAISCQFGNREDRETRQTGCIVQSHTVQGLGCRVRVVSCAHGVYDNLQVRAYGTRLGLADDGQLGRVVYMDPRLDMALIELRVVANQQQQQQPILNIPAFQLTAESLPEFADPVLAIGFPTGRNNLCTGIVCCPLGLPDPNDRHFTAALPSTTSPDDHHQHRASVVGQPGTVDIVHSAPIQRGYSGGPLLSTNTASGQLIGINHAICIDIGHAFSSNYISDFLKSADTYKQREFHRRRSEHRPIRLGYQFVYNLNSNCCLADKIVDTGASRNGSLKPGDQIVRLNGQPIESMVHLLRLLDNCPNNQPISVSVISRLEASSQPLDGRQSADKSIQLLATGLTYV
ncbi:uncharacterized protein LOC128956582 [Oppia nitens]|uniref:uncharacterized protein LOC128956582 n=1 Tax=Oppia nitens TaxID=1686743 RepID=UPI0023DA5A4A|nr:uncharacterized protein LOC128956582 [Oppia nitens]